MPGSVNREKYPHKTFDAPLFSVAPVFNRWKSQVTNLCHRFGRGSTTKWLTAALVFLCCTGCIVLRALRVLRGYQAALVFLCCAGCLVPQPRGDGRLTRVVEPTTKRGYWLYLPKEYVAADDSARRNRRWPIVASFHGMKPFDTAHRQAREWEQEADRYGFIVIAPELRAPDILRQFPVRKISASFKSDELASLAILDHVLATTHADPGNVLSTSWSSGGYLAHYLLNRHPDLFTCLAVRQSNFSETILNPQVVAHSRYHPIVILMAQNEFAGVKRECRQAIKWYEDAGYTNFAWVEIKGLGHQRTPDTAAAFFASVAGVKPNVPPTVLARRQAIAGNPRGLAMLAERTSTAHPSSTKRPVTSTPPTARRTQTKPRGTQSPATDGRMTRGPRIAKSPPTPSRKTASREAARPRSRMSIRVSSAIGTEPLILAFSADCPSDWHRTADFLWTLNGDPICNGVNGQKTITKPGEHTLGLLVVTRDEQEHRAYRLIRVLPHLGAARNPRKTEPEAQARE